MTELIEKRIKYNDLILNKLEELFFEHKEIRFGQFIHILELDDFDEEPWIAYNRIKKIKLNLNGGII